MKRYTRHFKEDLNIELEDDLYKLLYNKDGLVEFHKITELAHTICNMLKYELNNKDYENALNFLIKEMKGYHKASGQFVYSGTKLK